MFCPIYAIDWLGHFWYEKVSGFFQITYSYLSRLQGVCKLVTLRMDAYCGLGWVNLYQKFEIEKHTVCGKLILPKKNGKTF